MGKTFQVEGLEQKHQRVGGAGDPRLPSGGTNRERGVECSGPPLPTHHHGRTRNLCGLAVLWRKESVRAVLPTKGVGEPKRGPRGCWHPSDAEDQRS